jgi:predicted ATPase
MGEEFAIGDITASNLLKRFLSDLFEEASDRIKTLEMNLP